MIGPHTPRAADGTPQIYCQSCEEWNHRDDFRPDDFNDAALIEAHFGGPVCFACMDGADVFDYRAAARDNRDDYGDWKYQQVKDSKMDQEWAK